MSRIRLLLLACLCSLISYAQVAVDATKQIEYIDLIHLCHTDYGYTDNPDITQELHKKYIDIGIDAVLESMKDKSNPQFCWTAEVMETVYSWWQEATPFRRKELLKAVDSGQFEITAMTFNVNPLHNGRQVDKMLNWVPEDLWKAFKPKVAMQNDVNGFPRTYVMQLMDKGINHFWSGLNLHWGGIFHTPPHAFWWQMPDGRKAFVWLGMPYWEGYLFFADHEWRYAQRPAYNTQFRTPRTGDMLQADEASVRAAHQRCITRLNQMLTEGYPYDFISMSITNQYRCDNDAPFPALADFVAKWNELGLQPRLHFTTAAQSMEKMEKRIGDKIDTYKGEWPDWWAFGAAGDPRALSASRQADLYVRAAESPAWGKSTPNMLRQVDAIDRDLCQFYEHTLGSWDSNKQPFSLFTQAHYNTTFSYAYRPYEKSQWLLAQRVRSRLTNEPEGLYVVNTGGMKYTGWINIDPAAFVRVPYQSVTDPETGKKQTLFINDNRAKFWVKDLEPDRIYCYQLSTDEGNEITELPIPTIRTDQQGWPVSVQWNNHSDPFLSEGLGEFFSFNSLVGRSISRAWYEPDPVVRKQKIAESSMERRSSFKHAYVIETPHSVIYKQSFTHESLQEGSRTIEIFKEEPRVELQLTIDRKSNPDPEILYVSFPFPEKSGFPSTSNGGIPFAPYIDQIPGTCTDFLAIDGWVKYPDAKRKGSWLWTSRDAALISFGGNQFGTKSAEAPENMNQLCAMIYNNVWEVNVLNDCVGKMEFKFDILWSEEEMTCPQLTDVMHTYLLEPIIFVNPATREDKHTYKYLHEIR